MSETKLEENVDNHKLFNSIKNVALREGRSKSELDSAVWAAVTFEKMRDNFARELPGQRLV